MDKNAKHLIEVKEKLLKETAIIVDQNAALFLKNLKSTIHKRLETVAAEALGFSNSWNKWEIDHCNGRHSVVTNLITEKVQTIAKNSLDDILTEDKVKELMEKCKQSILNDFSNKFHDMLRNKFEQKAEKFVEEYANQLLESLKVQIQFDLHDPKTGDTKLGEAFMKASVNKEK